MVGETVNRAAELISFLVGPLAGVEQKALDSLPGKLGEEVVGLRSTAQEVFLALLLAGTGRFLRSVHS